MTGAAPKAREKDHKRGQRRAQGVMKGPVALTQAADLALLQRAIADPRAVAPANIKVLQRTAGNRAVTRLIQARLMVGPVGDAYEPEATPVDKQELRIPSQPSEVQCQDFEAIKRILRIWKRQIDRKSLPEYVYRLDVRPPAVIRNAGFQPWKPGGTITIKEHVRGVLDQALSTGSNLAKFESQFVSTAAYKGLADAVLLQGILDKYLYKIDTNYIGINHANFTDVNDYFDRIGEPRPYPKQREWIAQGGIPGLAVNRYMPGTAFAGQVGVDANDHLVLPDENQVVGWQPMPAGA